MAKKVVLNKEDQVSLDSCDENKIYVIVLDDILYKLNNINGNVAFVSLEDTSYVSMPVFKSIKDAIRAEIQACESFYYKCEGVVELNNATELAEWIVNNVTEIS